MGSRTYRQKNRKKYSRKPLKFPINPARMPTNSSQIYLIDLNSSFNSQKPLFKKIFSCNDYTTTLDNKYFTANLQLNTGDCLTLSHEAILITINSKTSSEELKESLERFEKCKLKLVTYDDCEVNRSSFMSLCMDFEAELIDLGDLEEGENSEDLVMASLNAVSWKSSVFKKSGGGRKGKTMGNGAENAEENSCKKSTKLGTELKKKPDSEINSKDVEDFENLFAQIGSFRDQAKNLTGDSRLDFAEKMMEQLLGSLDLDSEDDFQ